MKLALFSLRSAASFRNQSELIYKAGIKAGYDVTNRDLVERARYPRERWDRIIALAPLWPRYAFDCARLAAPWFQRGFTFYGPVDGPFLTNITFFKVIKQMRVVTTSRFCKRMIEQAGVPVADVCYHGINPGDFKFADIPKYDRLKQLRKKHPGKTIFFSNLNPLHRKGFPHLAKALAILTKKRPGDWIFYLHTGREKALKYHRGLAGVKNLVIEDAYNTLPFRQVALKTAACDVFVHPSLLEGFGLTVLEAAAAGRAIVCCDMEPLNEILNPGCAFMFPFREIKQEPWKDPGCIAQLHEYDPQVLADTMEYVMDHPKERAEKAAKARIRSRRFHYLKVYKKLLAG